MSISAVGMIVAPGFHTCPFLVLDRELAFPPLPSVLGEFVFLARDFIFKQKGTGAQACLGSLLRSQAPAVLKGQ